MSLQLIDTATGEIIRDYAPAAARHTRQLKQQAERRSKTRQRASRTVWPHLLLAVMATALIWLCR